MSGSSSERDAGESAVRFVERFCRHSKGRWAGGRIHLEPWQRDVVRRMFGTLSTDGTRRYRTVYVEVPRKNGKSTLAAAVALYLLFADKEPGAEVYSAAADREQAAIVFGTARAMVEAEPEMLSRAEVYRRAIVVPLLGASYKVISSEAHTKHGYNAHGIIFDEVHAQPNRELWDVLNTSTGARRQPMTFAITTAGVYDPESLCWQLHDYAEKVQLGVIDDPTFLPVLYGSGVDDDWKSPGVWRRANPSFGVTISSAYIERECQRAQDVLSYQNVFRRLHLNQWTQQASRWVDMHVWDRCDGVVDEEELVGKRCFAGLDLSSTTDVSAFVMLFDGGEIVCKFWIPEDTVYTRSRDDGVPYDVWSREGLVSTTGGNVVDYDVVRRDINRVCELYNVREIAIDRWNATQLTTQLMGDGHIVVPVGQGFASMSAPTKELEARLLSSSVCHGGHPVLRWMASNVCVRQDAAGNIKPDKAGSTERIDGIVALIMALDRHSRHPVDGDRSVYDGRGVLAI